jgi:hypothetical protein
VTALSIPLGTHITTSQIPLFRVLRKNASRWGDPNMHLHVQETSGAASLPEFAVMRKVIFALSEWVLKASTTSKRAQCKPPARPCSGAPLEWRHCTVPWRVRELDQVSYFNGRSADVTEPVSIRKGARLRTMP